LYDIWANDIIQPWATGEGVDQWYIKILLTIIAGGTLVVRVVMMILLVVVMLNFDKGLRQVLLEDKKHKHAALFTVSGTGDVVINAEEQNEKVKLIK
jgi:hypothetical protein